MKTIKILGAGPAGLTAAITLARAGREVVVYERGASVGTRHDGDIEALENFTTLDDVRDEWAQWGIAENFMFVPINEGTWYGPRANQKATVRDEKPILYFVKRGASPGALDVGLLQSVWVCPGRQFAMANSTSARQATCRMCLQASAFVWR